MHQQVLEVINAEQSCDFASSVEFGNIFVRHEKEFKELHKHFLEALHISKNVNVQG